MNAQTIRTVTYLVATIVANGIAGAEDSSRPGSRPTSILDRLNEESWATVVTDQGSYMLRVISEQDKLDIEKKIADYRAASSGGPTSGEPSVDYRAIPSDLRSGRFFRVQRYGSDAVRLTNDEIDALVPLTSIRVLLLGPSGSFSSGGPFDRRSALRGGFTGSEFQLRGGDAGARRRTQGGELRGLLGGSLGSIATSPEDQRDEESSRKINVFFLEYAEANMLADTIAAFFGDSDALLAIEPRLNAIVVQCDSDELKKIEQLIETLDRQSVHDDPDDKAVAPTLMAHDIGSIDGTTIHQVLQTMLAGRPDVRISVDIKNNRIIALGHPEDHEMIATIIERLAPAE